MGDFQQIEIRNGEKLYTSRNVGFRPVRIRELINLLQFGEGSEGLIAKRSKERKKDGIEMTCLDVERKNIKDKHEVCVNAASHDILSDEWQQLGDERHTELYSDYFDFGTHRYPRKLEMRVNGIRVITANLDTLITAPFDEKLLVSSKGAIERRQCADMKQATPVRTPDPTYPESARQNKMSGDTAAAMTVLTDGSVTDVQLIGSATRSMDDATLKTLQGWRFKPAMCGADPVVSDIEVVVSFSLY